MMVPARLCTVPEGRCGITCMPKMASVSSTAPVWGLGWGGVVPS